MLVIPILFMPQSVYGIESGSAAGGHESKNDADGGGIFSDTNFTDETSQLVRCTIAGNSSGSGLGGGYYNNIGLSQLIHCTVTGNTAPDGSGGGIASFGDGDTRTELTATLVRDNPGGDVVLVFGSTNSFQSNGNNLVGTGNGTGNFTGETNTDTTTSDPGNTRNPVLMGDGSGAPMFSPSASTATPWQAPSGE